jgi:OFA family oxalate/formate antiporter-like MFS transporter
MMFNGTEDTHRIAFSCDNLSALAGLMLFSFGLGSVHAFSVFLPAMEREFVTSWMVASLTYSIALVSLALGVLVGHRLYSKVAPATYVAAIGLLAAAGCLLAGLGGSVTMVWIGYGLFFGGANGLGYGHALQLSALAMPRRKGLAMGAVNAAYALGAVVFPVPLAAALDEGGWTAALLVLSFAIIVFAVAGSILLARSRMLYARSADCAASTGDVGRKVIVSFWLAYGCAVMAGLMVMGQATGIAWAAGAGEPLIVASPAVVAASNMLGCILCGLMLDKVKDGVLLAFLALLTFTALIAMAFLPQSVVTIIGLAAVGFAYGGVVSVFPASISRSFGVSAGARVYGRVFTGWAAAGLLGPGLAGWLYDLHGNYRMALVVAAVLGALSPAFLPRANRT